MGAMGPRAFTSGGGGEDYAWDPRKNIFIRQIVEVAEALF